MVIVLSKVGVYVTIPTFESEPPGTLSFLDLYGFN